MNLCEQGAMVDAVDDETAFPTFIRTRFRGCFVCNTCIRYLYVQWSEQNKMNLNAYGAPMAPEVVIIPNPIDVHEVPAPFVQTHPIPVYIEEEVRKFVTEVVDEQLQTGGFKRNAAALPKEIMPAPGSVQQTAAAQEQSVLTAPFATASKSNEARSSMLLEQYSDLPRGLPKAALRSNDNLFDASASSLAAEMSQERTDNATAQSTDLAHPKVPSMVIQDRTATARKRMLIRAESAHSRTGSLQAGASVKSMVTASDGDRRNLQSPTSTGSAFGGGGAIASVATAQLQVVAHSRPPSQSLPLAVLRSQVSLIRTLSGRISEPERPTSLRLDLLAGQNDAPVPNSPTFSGVSVASAFSRSISIASDASRVSGRRRTFQKEFSYSETDVLDNESDDFADYADDDDEWRSVAESQPPLSTASSRRELYVDDGMTSASGRSKRRRFDFVLAPAGPHFAPLARAVSDPTGYRDSPTESSVSRGESSAGHMSFQHPPFLKRTTMQSVDLLSGVDDDEFDDYSNEDEDILRENGEENGMSYGLETSAYPPAHLTSTTSITVPPAIPHVVGDSPASAPIRVLPNHAIEERGIGAPEPQADLSSPLG
jgi:hypothetical protein